MLKKAKIKFKIDDNCALLLFQHACQNNLNHQEQRLIKWTVYSELQENEQLISHEKLDRTLHKRERPSMFHILEDNEKKIFWRSTSRLLTPCLDFIRDLRTKRDAHDELKSTLYTLRMMIKFKTSEDSRIFTRLDHGWLGAIYRVDILYTVEQILTTSSNDHFDASVDYEVLESNDPEQKINHCIELVKMTRADVEQLSYQDSLFMV